MKPSISINTPIPGPKSQALLARRKAAVPQGPFNIAPIFVECGEGATVVRFVHERLSSVPVKGAKPVLRQAAAR